MAFITAPKTLLLLVLLSVIQITAARADDAPQVYRFGEWTLVVPASISTEALSAGATPLQVPAGGLELLAYWQDGRQRAVSLRFDGSDAKKDLVVLKTFDDSNRLRGCDFGAGTRVTPMKKALPKDAVAVGFPDDGALQLAGSERGLRRNGDMLVADMGGARVQLVDDSPIVRVGEWNSADFCRFELKLTIIRDDD